MNSPRCSDHAWRAAIIVSAVAALFGATSVRAAEATAGWQADPKALEALAATGVSWRHDENEIPKYDLPDPLKGAGGSRITTAQEWEQQQRPQNLELFRRWVYGRAPGQPEH